MQTPTHNAVMRGVAEEAVEAMDRGSASSDHVQHHVHTHHHVFSPERSTNARQDALGRPGPGGHPDGAGAPPALNAHGPGATSRAHYGHTFSAARDDRKVRALSPPHTHTSLGQARQPLSSSRVSTSALGVGSASAGRVQPVGRRASGIGSTGSMGASSGQHYNALAEYGDHTYSRPAPQHSTSSLSNAAAVVALSSELETLRQNWRSEGAVARGKMVELHQAKLAAEEALQEARARARAAELAQAQTVAALRAELDELRVAQESARTESVRQEEAWLGKVSELQSAGERATAELARARAEIADLRQENEDLTNQVEAKNSLVDTLEARLEHARQTTDKTREEASRVQGELRERLQNTKDEWAAEIAQLSAELTAVTEEAGQASAATARTAREKLAMEDALSQKLDAVTAERDLARAQAEQLRQLLATAEAEFGAVATAVDLLSSGTAIPDDLGAD